MTSLSRTVLVYYDVAVIQSLRSVTTVVPYTLESNTNQLWHALYPNHSAGYRSRQVHAPHEYQATLTGFFCSLVLNEGDAVEFVAVTGQDDLKLYSVLNLSFFRYR